MNPKLAEAQQNAESSNYELALKQYSEIILQDGKNWKAYNGRAICKTSLNDYHGALKDYQKALELDPDKYKVLNNLGHFHHEIGDYESSIDYYNQALKINKNDMVFRNRGNSFMQIGKYEQAISDFNKAYEIDDSDFESLTNIGNAYEDLGIIEKAIEYWNRALKINPEHLYASWKLNFENMPTATRKDWLNDPMTTNRIKMEIGIGLTPDLYKCVKKGLIPKSKNDKWFIYFEKDTLYCHISTSGYCIYELHFEKERGEYIATDIFYEGDMSRNVIYKPNDIVHLTFLVYFGLCYGLFGPEVRHTYIEVMLKEMSFDDLENKFGSILYK